MLVINLVVYFVYFGQVVILLDLDLQQFVIQWVWLCEDLCVEVFGWLVDELVLLGWLQDQMQKVCDVVVIDFLVGMDCYMFDYVLWVLQIVLILVLFSFIDICVIICFVQNVMLVFSYQCWFWWLVVIVNWVCICICIYEILCQFFVSLKIFYLIMLCDVQQYVQLMSYGESMFDQKDFWYQVDQCYWWLIGEWLEVQWYFIQILLGFC